MTAKDRVLLVSIVPPKNDCGVRIVMHRQLVERHPFELHVASNADFTDALVHTPLRLPYFVDRIRKSRFGPRLAAWITDYENFVWPLTTNTALEEAVQQFKPDVVLTLAECGLCQIARKTAQRHGLPLAGLFLDWFPVTRGHYGHKSTRGILSRRYRELYAACDLAFCTSDGMQEMLGPHPNSHVIYPMPGKHSVPAENSWPRSNVKFRLVYVGAVKNFYGRMLCSLIEKIKATTDLELIVIGPNADWPKQTLERARASGTYLGFKPPAEAAEVLASADALLVVMSFEKEHELFMRTSFTTKFLDYAAFGKPVILWGPEYCTPVRVAKMHGAAAVVSSSDADAVVALSRQIAADSALSKKLSDEALQLHQTLFNPDRLQDIFVQKITELVDGQH